MSFMPLTAASLPPWLLVLHLCHGDVDAGRHRRSSLVSKTFFDVVFDHCLEVAGNGIAAQGHAFFAVDEDRRRRRLAGSGKTDSDIGVLALTRAVDDAAHHGHLELLDPGILLAPNRHLRAQEIVDLLGQFLERRAGGTSAAGTRRDTGHERSRTPERLQNLGGDHHFLGTGFARRRRQRNPDRVANALLQQDRQRRARGHHALGAHARFGQPEMQRVVAALDNAR